MKIFEPFLLCEGASGPGPDHNAGLPSMVRCPDGSLLLAHRIGTHKNSHDGRQLLWRSRDEGRSWSRIPFPFTRSPDDVPSELRTTALSDIGGGRLGMMLTWIVHPDVDSPLANAKTGGLLPIHIGCAFSSDSGASWSPLREIDVTPRVQPCGNGPMVRLQDGRLLAGYELYKHFDDPSPWSARSAISFSSDDGKTWERPAIVSEDPSHSRSYWDTHFVPLSDGTIVGFNWMDDGARPGISEIHRVFSRDRGETWSKTEPTGLSGQYSFPLLLPNSDLGLFYVVRSENSAIRLAFSSDAGRTWRTDEGWVIYSQAANDLAEAKGGDFAAYLQSMGRWTFGWPSPLLLGPKEILVAYYAGEGDRSSIYLRRVLL